MRCPLGTLKNIGNIFLTICLADNTTVRRRITSLRMLRPFKVPDLTTKVPNLTTTQTLICADLSNSDIEVNVKGQLPVKLCETISAPFLKFSYMHHIHGKGELSERLVAHFNFNSNDNSHMRKRLTAVLARSRLHGKGRTY